MGENQLSTEVNYILANPITYYASPCKTLWYHMELFSHYLQNGITFQIIYEYWDLAKKEISFPYRCIHFIEPLYTYEFKNNGVYFVAPLNLQSIENTINDNVKLTKIVIIDRSLESFFY